MTPETMHDEMRAALAAEALGALDGEERTLLHAHLAACQACRAELAELRASVGTLGFAAAPAPLEPARSDRIRARLLARAAADRGAGGGGADGDGSDGSDGVDRTVVAPPPPILGAVPPASTPPARFTVADDDDTQVIPITAAPSRRPSRAGWLAAAASLALLLLTGAYAFSLRGEVDALRGNVAAAERDSRALERELAAREATLAAVSAPAVQVIDLASSGQAAPGGRMFWDRRSNRWTFFAHNLPAVQRGREYQLWFITPGNRKIPSSSFRPGPQGQAQVVVDYTLPADSLQAVAITEEPAGGLPAPSGPVVLVGAASSR